MPERNASIIKWLKIVIWIVIVLLWAGVLLYYRSTLSPTSTNPGASASNTISKNIFRSLVLPYRSAMSIYQLYNPVGTIETDIIRADAGYELTNRTQFGLGMLNQPVKLNSTAHAFFDAEGRWQSFNVDFASGVYDVQLEGARTEENTLRLKIITGGKASEQLIELPENFMIGDQFNGALALFDIPEEGESRAYQFFDPLSQKPISVKITNAGMKPIIVAEDGRRETVPGTILQFDYQGLIMPAVINERREIMTLDSPLGLTMVRNGVVYGESNVN